MYPTKKMNFNLIKINQNQKIDYKLYKVTPIPRKKAEIEFYLRPEKITEKISINANLEPKNQFYGRKIPIKNELVLPLYYETLKLMKVEDIMSKNLVTLDSNSLIIESIKKMSDNKVNAIPLMKKNKLVGIITQTDITKLINKYLKVKDITSLERIIKEPIESIFKPKILMTASPDDSLYNVDFLMKTFNIRHIIVTEKDKEDNLLGIISSNDLYKIMKEIINNEKSMILKEFLNNSKIVKDFLDNISPKYGYTLKMDSDNMSIKSNSEKNALKTEDVIESFKNNAKIVKNGLDNMSSFKRNKKN